VRFRSTSLIYLSSLRLPHPFPLQHMTMKDCWIILGRADQKMVYDVSEYLADHPGGPEVILEQAGVMYSFAFLLTLPRERC
jgi:cytochrome b involved in lipid metabolism